jgi:hypothetical protein
VDELLSGLHEVLVSLPALLILTGLGSRRGATVLAAVMVMMMVVVLKPQIGSHEVG